MLVLIIGGSASGKSEFAENLAMGLSEKKLYIATMQPFDAECEKRIQKHQDMRRNKGFETREQYRDLHLMRLQGQYDTALIECVSNLLANEMYGGQPGQNVFVNILKGIEHVSSLVNKTIIVSNEIFCDGDAYSEETLAYIRFLGQINAALAQKADAVIEMVCGVPIFHKGTGCL